MQRFLLLFLITFSISTLQAQDHNHEVCGTVDQDLTWLRKFQQNPELFPMPEDDLIVAALQVHNLGQDSGTGFYHIDDMLNSLCRLQEGFAETDIQFYLYDDINYISNTAWNNHEGFQLGSQMMNQNKVSGALNTFITSEAAGNCGYYSPGPDACVVAKNCAGGTGHTWAHELGHYLSLPHTFYGWEGIKYDPNTPTSSYENQVWGAIEKLDGSNCDGWNDAADGFCDTPPDYLSERWNCNSNGVSGVILTDPNGETFQADGTFIMSYSIGACRSKFSEEQAAAMRADLMFNRSEVILDVEIEEIDIEDFATIHPQAGDVVPYNFIELEWEPIPGATHYFVEVIWDTWGLVKFEKVVETNSVIVTELSAEKDYVYRVRPYNYGYFCAGYSEEIPFETSNVTAVNELSAVSEIEVFPTILKNGNNLNINFQSEVNIGDADLVITSMTGIRQSTQSVQINAGTNRLNLRPENLSSGIYFVSIETEEGSFYEKFIIQ